MNSEDPKPEQRQLTLAEVEKLHILRVLECCQWNRTKTAKVLGVSLRTVRNKLARYRVDGLTPP